MEGRTFTDYGGTHTHYIRGFIMAKVSGKDLQFWFGVSGALIEYPVTGVTFDGAWQELETTDSSTLTPATDFIVNRAKRTLKVDALMAAAHGPQVATGNTILGTKYQVMSGNITQNGIVYTTKKLFTGDGTVAATATNQIAPLGAKLPGKSIIGNLNNSAVGVTALKYTETYGEFETTDSNSPTDTTEFVTGRVKRTASVEMIMVDTTADMVEASPVAIPAVFTFGSGLTITGSAVFTKKSITSLAKGDVVKVAYDLTWVGQPVSTLLHMLPMGTPASGTAHSFYLKWKGMGSTDKEVLGTAVCISMAIEADVNDICKVSYGLDVVGAVTENEYT